MATNSKMDNLSDINSFWMRCHDKVNARAILPLATAGEHGELLNEWLENVLELGLCFSFDFSNPADENPAGA